MLPVLRVGCPWRDVHERYDKRDLVSVGFKRGVWDALLLTLVEPVLTYD